MANVTLQGNPIHTVGELPKVGSPSPDVRLTRGDLSNISLAGFEGKREGLNWIAYPHWIAHPLSPLRGEGE